MIIKQIIIITIVVIVDVNVNVDIIIIIINCYDYYYAQRGRVPAASSTADEIGTPPTPARDPDNQCRKHTYQLYHSRDTSLLNF